MSRSTVTSSTRAVCPSSTFVDSSPGRCWSRSSTQDLAGERTVSTFRDAMARIVAHEVDHLGGLLYPDRMPSDGRLIPIEEYQGHGEPWRYPSLGPAPSAS